MTTANYHPTPPKVAPRSVKPTEPSSSKPASANPEMKEKGTSEKPTKEKGTLDKPTNQKMKANGNEADAISSPPRLRTLAAAIHPSSPARTRSPPPRPPPQAAYVKLALHALKHQAAAVNGLLVVRLADPAASPAVVSIADAVPLSHQPHHLPLLPTLELALTLVEDHFQAQGLAVVGYYHANARRNDADLPAVTKRVGDHIFRYFPRAAMLLLDNVKLEEVVKGSIRDAVVQWLWKEKVCFIAA
ncbi:ER membrane protein complex subunit 8/9 homolog [Triticum aestivum]|uniref:ER membrane protein complex subunit 8/9 homolog n=1 Tax=Triticum aestivum TaxID=4565 RepID=UPI001D006E85|nr:ER membrane protein complex subunit 8/9 homolog [Triticum aestivum]